MDYLELTCTVSPRHPGTDILIAQLAEAGFESFAETETGLTAYIPLPHFSKEALTNIFTIHSKVMTCSYVEKIIKDENWNKEWEKNFAPVNVDDTCYIRAPFHPRLPHIVYDIVIEPKMSFGTGHHETTFMMVREIVKMDLEGKTVLDMGCGSGILAVLAAKKGAGTVTAVDIEEWAYLNAIENAANNTTNGIKVIKGNAEILQGQIFHSIFANINKNILLADIEKYTESLLPQGHLLISGFFESDVSELLNKATALGLALLSRSVKNNWALLHLIKR